MAKSGIAHQHYQMNRCLAVSLIALFVTGPVEAAQRQVIKIGWSGFQQEVSARKLRGRMVRITPAGGGEIKTKLLSVADNGLVVRATPATNQWASGKKEATIPKGEIRSVRFLGHVGHRGLLLGLAGFGAGIGIGAALAASQDVLEISEGPVGIAAGVGIVAGAIGVGLAGYFIGRATSRQAPEFVIEQ